MPFPLIPVIIGVAAAAGTAAAGVAIADALNQPQTPHTRKLLLLGRSQVGKTTVRRWITEGRFDAGDQSGITEKDEARIGGEKVAWVDPNGDPTFLEDWLDGLDQADVLVYVFDASKVARKEPGLLAGMEADADLLAKALRDRQPRTVIVGTHADKIDDLGQATKIVVKHSSVQGVLKVTGANDQDVFMGSLLNREGAESLLGPALEKVGLTWPDEEEL